jgi:TPR repeat protein
MYEMGWGTRADKKKAVEMYTKAAQKGNQLARDNLRRLGVAVPETADAAGALTNTTNAPPPPAAEAPATAAGTPSATAAGTPSAAQSPPAPASTTNQKSDAGLPTVAAPATTAAPATQQP